MAKSKKHPLLRQAQQNIRQGKLNPPKNGAVFWSDNAKRYEDKDKDNNTELTYAFCKAATPGRYKMLSMNVALSAFQDESIPLDTRNEVARLYSTTFARAAMGTIYVAVDRSEVFSFFRTTELPEIMGNNNIKKVSRLIRNADQSISTKSYSKGQWFVEQHKIWLRDALEKMAEALTFFKQNHNRFYEKHLESCLEDVLLEIGESCDLTEEYPNTNPRLAARIIKNMYALIEQYPALIPYIEAEDIDIELGNEAPTPVKTPAPA